MPSRRGRGAGGAHKDGQEGACRQTGHPGATSRRPLHASPEAAAPPCQHPCSRHTSSLPPKSSCDAPAAFLSMALPGPQGKLKPGLAQGGLGELPRVRCCPSAAQLSFKSGSRAPSLSALPAPRPSAPLLGFVCFCLSVLLKFSAVRTGTVIFIQIEPLW